MNLSLSSLSLTSFKYAYLIVFFALLAGFFHPIITNSSFDTVIGGVLVLLLGLAGGVLIYMATHQPGRRKWYFMGGGFGLMTISLYYIIVLSGRA